MVREHVQKNKKGYAKLVAVIVGLTAAVKAYTGLEEQNAMILQAVATKLNSLSEEVAYIKGMCVAMRSVETVSVSAPAPVEPVPASRPTFRPMSRPAAPPVPVPTEGAEEDAMGTYLDKARVHMEVHPDEHSEGGPTNKEVRELAAYMMLHSEGEPVAYVGETGEPTPIKAQMQIRLDAYDVLPLTMEGLEQLQIQEEE